MQNDTFGIATTTSSGTDPIAAALRNLADAGITFTEVARCPADRCALCAPQAVPHAA